jgi:hypothetical protein
MPWVFQGWPPNAPCSAIVGHTVGGEQQRRCWLSNAFDGGGHTLQFQWLVTAAAAAVLLPRKSALFLQHMTCVNTDCLVFYSWIFWGRTQAAGRV